MSKYKIQKEDIEEFIQKHKYLFKAVEKTGYKPHILSRVAKSYGLEFENFFNQEEFKKNAQKKRKEFFEKNPDKHPWRRKNKFNSPPCENLKMYLALEGVSFVEEFPENSGGKNYMIDIAVCDKKIAIEVNGNMHYERDGRLKPYYEDRENHLKQLGWKVFQIHYSLCFKECDLKNIKRSIDEVEINPLFSKEIVEKIISEKLEKKINKTICPCCGGKKLQDSQLCGKCSKEKRKKEGGFRKVSNRPSKEELTKLIKEIGYTKTGEKFGVTDNAVKKWAKEYGLNIRLSKDKYSGEKIPKDILIKRLQNESIEEISENISCCVTLIKKWATEYGITTEQIKEFQTNRSYIGYPAKEELEKDFLSGLTLREISEKYGKQREGIKTYCLRFGIKGIEKVLRK